MGARALGTLDEDKGGRQRRRLCKVLLAAGLVGATAVAGPAAAQPPVVSGPGQAVSDSVLAFDPDQREWERKQKQKQKQKAAARAAARRPSGSKLGRVSSSDAVVRKGPGTQYASSGRVKRGAKVTILCQTKGSKVSGPAAKNSPWWNKISGPTPGWVSDAFVKTGSTGRVARACKSNEVPQRVHARTAPKPTRPAGAACVWGPRQRRFVSADVKHGPDLSFVRFTLEPFLCPKGGRWVVAENPPAFENLGSADTLKINLALEAPRPLGDGVEWSGRVRHCPKGTIGVAAGVSASTDIQGCYTLGRASVRARVAGGKVSYTWKMTTTDWVPKVAIPPNSAVKVSLRKLHWTDKVAGPF
jgi:hypothetical protein